MVASIQLDSVLCRFPESKDFVGQGTHHYQYVRWLGFRKQDVAGVNPVVDADDANDSAPEDSRNIASSRLPRKAFENFGITSSSPLCNGAMSCLHSGLWRSLSSLSNTEMAEDVVESFLARNGATRDVAKLNEHEFKVFGNKVATKSEVECFANTSQMGKGAS